MASAAEQVPDNQFFCSSKNPKALLLFFESLLFRTNQSALCTANADGLTITVAYAPPGGQAVGHLNKSDSADPTDVSSKGHIFNRYFLKDPEGSVAFGINLDTLVSSLKFLEHSSEEGCVVMRLGAPGDPFVLALQDVNVVTDVGIELLDLPVPPQMPAVEHQLMTLTAKVDFIRDMYSYIDWSSDELQLLVSLDPLTLTLKTQDQILGSFETSFSMADPVASRSIQTFQCASPGAFKYHTKNLHASKKSLGRGEFISFHVLHDGSLVVVVVPVPQLRRSSVSFYIAPVVGLDMD